MHSDRFERKLKIYDFVIFFNRFLKETLRVLYLFPLAFAATLPVIFFFAIPASSQTFKGVPNVASDAIGSRDPIFHEPVSRGIHLVFNGRFEASLVIFNRLLKEYPDHPAPNFFKAAAYQIWMGDYRVNRYQKELEENIKSAIHKGKELLKTESDPWLNFYVGAAYGYQAFSRFRKHEWIGAYRDSKKGINHLKETLALNQSVYDVYLAFGTYHYWRTAKSKFLRIFAFWIPDKRELGLRQLQFSIDHGQYSPFEASYALIAAYFDYGEYQKAYTLLNRTIEKKEQLNFSDLYLKGRLFMKFERWLEAESHFLELLRRLESSKYPSIGYQVECKYWIAYTLRSQKKISEAIAISEQALAQSEKRNVDLEVESPFENFKDIKDNLKTIVRELS